MKYALREMKPTTGKTRCMAKACGAWCLLDFVLVLVGKFREDSLNYICSSAARIDPAP
jgi:hypothetical protein